MSIKRRLLCTTALTVLGGWAAFTAGAISPAWSADLNFPTKAPAIGCVPAVDGINGKFSAWGGSFADDALYGGTGSLSLPLGCEFGAQIDGTVASFDSRFVGSVAGHLFWRNPAEGLLGVYGSYTSWDQAGGVRVGYLGPEAAWYAGRWTLEGVAGVESGNSTTGLVDGVLTSFDLKTRFFDQVNVAYYLQDNFKVFAGHRYLGGENALALGGEYGVPLSHGVMASLFAEGRIGEDRYRGVWGGVRLYFGQHDKTLIRRHREDDPSNYLNDFGGLTNIPKVTSALSPPLSPPPPPPPTLPPPPLLPPPPPL